MSTINLQGGNTLLSSGFFPPVRVASTGSPLNPSTGGLLTVDGITLIAGDRVLCKDETSSVNNGIYAANTGPWVRTSDASNNQQFFSGMGVVCALGSTNAKSIFICTCTDDPVVVGTSLITFAAQIPVGSGSVVGPVSSTTGHVAGFASATGQLLEDISTTGTGQVVFSVSPSLTTPFLDHATASTFNNVAITQPAGTATLTISSSATVAFTNSLTISATSGATLTVNNLGLTLSGTSGKTFTLDNSLEFAGTDATKFTFPSVNDIVVGVTAVQTLYNKTFSAPTFSGGTIFTTSITATSGIFTTSVTSTGGLVVGASGGSSGTVTFIGSAGGTFVIATGSTGTPQYGGTATNDSAPAGDIGEYVSFTLSSAGAITMTSAQGVNIGSIPLTAGDWDVSAQATFTGNPATTVSSLICSISFVSATLDSTDTRQNNNVFNGWAVLANANPRVPVGPSRFSVSSTTAVYLVADATFGTSSCSVYGTIRARRPR